MTTKDVATKLGNIIKLNVGGHNFTTRLGTLIKDNPSSSKVKQWFLPEPSLKIDTKGRYYIDRDPEHFAIILEYLRTGWIPLHMGECMIELLIIETKFYDIPALLSHLVRMREMRSGIKYISKYSMETIKLNITEKQEPISTTNDFEKVKDAFKTLIIRKIMEYFRNNSEQNEAKTWIYMSSEEDQNKDANEESMLQDALKLSEGFVTYLILNINNSSNKIGDASDKEIFDVYKAIVLGSTWELILSGFPIKLSIPKGYKMRLNIKNSRSLLEVCFDYNLRNYAGYSDSSRALLYDIESLMTKSCAQLKAFKEKLN